MIPSLPTEIWLIIFTEVAKQKRLEWWSKLSEIEREYREWPFFDEELAEHMLDDVFERF
jgi:hypothetical protein